MTQIPMTENHFGEMKMLEETAKLVGMNQPDDPDSRYVAQPVDNFLLSCEEESMEKPITMEEDEGFERSIEYQSYKLTADKK